MAGMTQLVHQLQRDRAVLMQAVKLLVPGVPCHPMACELLGAAVRGGKGQVPEGKGRLLVSGALEGSE